MKSRSSELLKFLRSKASALPEALIGFGWNRAHPQRAMAETATTQAVNRIAPGSTRLIPPEFSPTKPEMARTIAAHGKFKVQSFRGPSPGACRSVRVTNG